LSRTFVDITTEIIEVGKQYKEVDESVEYIFMNLIRSFMEGVRFASENGENLNDAMMKRELFEIITGHSIEDEYRVLLEGYSPNEQCCGTNDGGKQENINNVDEDVLKSIRENIKDYLG